MSDGRPNKGILKQCKEVGGLRLQFTNRSDAVAAAGPNGKAKRCSQCGKRTYHIN